MRFLIPATRGQRASYKYILTEIQYRFQFFILVAAVVVMHHEFGPTIPPGTTILGTDITRIPNFLHSAAIAFALGCISGWVGCQYYWDALDRADHGTTKTASTGVF